MSQEKMGVWYIHKFEEDIQNMKNMEYSDR
jgi:hypothetical protein